MIQYTLHEFYELIQTYDAAAVICSHKHGCTMVRFNTKNLQFKTPYGSRDEAIVYKAANESGYLVLAGKRIELTNLDKAHGQLNCDFAIDGVPGFSLSAHLKKN